MNRFRSVGAFVCVLSILWSLSLLVGSSNAKFTDQAAIPQNLFRTDSLDAPMNLTAGSGASPNAVVLTWTATRDTYAAGHRIYRTTSVNGQYTLIAQVTPRSQAAYTDRPAAGTYFYVVRAYFQNWESGNSNQISVRR